MSRRRVYVHVGAPKTGTTYLQDRLTINARSLRQHDVHFPTGSRFVSPALFQFRAALDLLDQDWGGPAGHAKGAWSTLVARTRRRTGTVIVSHEILAPIEPDQIARVKRELGGPDTELHVVYSARDLGRQIPAAWQESIKQGRRWSFRRYLNRVKSGQAWFYQAFDLPTVLDAWSAGLPPERFHLVTVPHRSAPPTSVPGTPAPRGDELWRRFCTAFGIDPAWAPRESDRVNASLGAAETQLLRQLNRRLDRATRREASFDGLIRDMLAQSELVKRQSKPVRMPPGVHPWAQAEAERWIEHVRASGVHVVGDLEELRPLPPVPGERWVNPDKIRPRAQLDAALDALTAMTREAARRPDPDQRLIAKARIHAQQLRTP